MKCKSLLAMALISACGLGNANDAAHDVDPILRVGDIHGTVNICGTGGRSGVLVYMPGRSFMARTDEQGAFRLSYVPVGTYRLLFEQGGTDLGRTDAVHVQARRVTELGAVNVCADTVCPAEYDPVCGADGNTYPNPCEAQRVAVPIIHTGVCP